MEVLMAVIGGGAITGGLALMGTVYSAKKAQDSTVAIVQTEIRHVKGDIEELKIEQRKSNEIKARLAVCENNIKAICKQVYKD